MSQRTKFHANRSKGTPFSRHTAFLTSLVKTRQNWWRHIVGKNVGILPIFVCVTLYSPNETAYQIFSQSEMFNLVFQIPVFFSNTNSIGKFMGGGHEPHFQRSRDRWKYHYWCPNFPWKVRKSHLYHISMIFSLHLICNYDKKIAEQMCGSWPPH